MHRAPPPYSIQLSRLTEVRVSLYSPDTSKLPPQSPEGQQERGDLTSLVSASGLYMQQGQNDRERARIEAGGAGGKNAAHRPQISTVKSASAWLSPPLLSPSLRPPWLKLAAAGLLRDQGRHLLTNRPPLLLCTRP